MNRIKNCQVFKLCELLVAYKISEVNLIGWGHGTFSVTKHILSKNLFPKDGSKPWQWNRVHLVAEGQGEVVENPTLVLEITAWKVVVTKTILVEVAVDDMVIAEATAEVSLIIFRSCTDLKTLIVS